MPIFKIKQKLSEVWKIKNYIICNIVEKHFQKEVQYPKLSLTV
jgi:hypothetical protein